MKLPPSVSLSQECRRVIAWRRLQGALPSASKIKLNIYKSMSKQGGLSVSWTSTAAPLSRRSTDLWSPTADLKPSKIDPLILFCIFNSTDFENYFKKPLEQRVELTLEHTESASERE
ncbi:MAG: hypothetical protein SGPRY_014709 [Prymnesium sp.]